MANKRIYDLTEDTTPSSGDFLATDKSGNVEATKVDVAKFAILAGQAGGQTLYGDTAANGDLILHGTSSATRTTSYVLLQPTAGNVGIGTTAPTAPLDVTGVIHASAGISTGTNAADAGMFRVPNSEGALLSRNAANDGNVGAFFVDGADRVQLAYSGASGVLIPAQFTGIGLGRASVANSDHVILFVGGANSGVADITTNNTTVTSGVGAAIYPSLKMVGDTVNHYGLKVTAYTIADTTPRTLTNQYGIYIVDGHKDANSTVTNGFGLYIETPTVGSTLNAGIYNGGTLLQKGLIIVTHPTGAASLQIGAWDANADFAAIGLCGSISTTGYNFLGSGGQGLFINRESGQPIRFRENNVDQVLITANSSIQVGGTAARGTTAGTNRIDLFDGTAPTGTLTNGVSIYSKAGEFYALDAAGNETLNSPHDPETGEWIFWSRNTVTGRTYRVDMERMVAAIEALTGQSFTMETFA